MSTRKTLCLLLLLAITTSALATSYFFAAAEVGPDWHEEPVRVIIQSTSDWGRMLFDDLNGTNSNGLGISRVQTVDGRSVRISTMFWKRAGSLRGLTKFMDG